MVPSGLSCSVMSRLFFHTAMRCLTALDVVRGFELLVSHGLGWKVIFRPESKLKEDIRKEFKLKRVSSEWMA